MIRPRQAHRAGADRWLVSYADFMTLLLAFFTAMYAVSDVDPGKLASAAASVREALDAPSPSPETPPTRPAVPATAPAAAPTTPGIDDVREHIAADLSSAISAGRLELGADERGLVLSLPESATFPVASADVTATARTVIDRLAATLVPLGNGVRVEGHTDDVPIRTPRFGSNWELSTARASAVVARLIEQHVDPRRLSAAGYGEFHPRVPNDSAAGRASNRRVDIVIISVAPRPQVQAGTNAGTGGGASAGD